MTTLYSWARKAHRYFALVTSTLKLFMAGTGLMLKYPSKFGFIDLLQVRSLHNSLSIFFVGAIVVMSLTGLTMYFGPGVIKRMQKRANRQQTLQE